MGQIQYRSVAHRRCARVPLQCACTLLVLQLSQTACVSLFFVLRRPRELNHACSFGLLTALLFPNCVQYMPGRVCVKYSVQAWPEQSWIRADIVLQCTEAATLWAPQRTIYPEIEPP